MPQTDTITDSHRRFPAGPGSFPAPLGSHLTRRGRSQPGWGRSRYGWAGSRYGGEDTHYAGHVPGTAGNAPSGAGNASFRRIQPIFEDLSSHNDAGGLDAGPVANDGQRVMVKDDEIGLDSNIGRITWSPA